MKKLLIFLFMLPVLLYGQNIVGTKAITYTAGVPTHTPTILGAWISMDTSTAILRKYNWSTGDWDVMGVYNESLQIVGNNLRITDGNGTLEVSLSPYLDNTDTSGYNSSLYVSTDTLFLTDGDGTLFAVLPPSSDTSGYNSSLTISNDSLLLADGNGTLNVVLSPYLDNTDDQTLSIDSTANSYSLSIEDGNTVSWTKTSLSGYVTGSGTTNELPYWATSSSLGSLSTATYPSLTELSYVKGVTSAIQTQLDAKHGGSLTSGYIPYSSGGYGLANSGVQYDNASGAVTFPSATTGGAIMRDWTASSQYFAIYPKSVTPGAGNYSFLINSTSAYLNAPGSGGNAIISVQGTEKARFSASTIGLNSTGTANTAVTIKGSGSTNLTTALLVENSAGTDALVVLDNTNIGINTTTPNAALHMTTGNIKVGSFTTGAGVTDEAIITDKIIRASGGFNLRAPTVGDNTQTGMFPGSGSDVIIKSGSSPVLTIQNNETANSGAAVISRQYNPLVFSGEVSNWKSSLSQVTSSASTASFNNMEILGTINQTGSNTSITRGIYIHPALTSAYDYRSLEVIGGTAIFSTASSPTKQASAIIQAESTTQGLLPPRMTTAQRDAISSPELGLQLVSTTDSLPYYWNGTAYVGMYADGTGTDSQDFTGSDDGTTFTWDLSGASNDPSITEGQNIAMSRSGEDVTISVDRILDDDVYTPVGVDSTNITVVVKEQAQYLRVGSSVTVSGYIVVTAAAPGSCSIQLDLPVASDFTTTLQAAGVFHAPDDHFGGIIRSNATNNSIQIAFDAPDTSAHPISYQYTYRIL